MTLPFFQQHIQIQTPTLERQRKEVGQYRQSRNPPLLVRVAFPQNPADLKAGKKSPHSPGKALPFFVLKCYTFHNRKSFLWYFSVVFQRHYTIL